MKKFLLSTALSIVFVMPVYAEDVSAPAPAAADQVQAATMAPEAAAEAVQEVVTETVVEDGVVVKSVKDAPAVAEKSAEVVEQAEEAVEVSKVIEEVAHEAPPEETMEVMHDTVEKMAEPEHVEPSAHAAAAHWSYTGADAAPYWGTLDEGYHACAKGQTQSPINISKFLQEDLPEILPSYSPSSLSVVNNGHTIQVNYEAGSSFSADNVKYDLLQFHFHTPSEHYLDGAPYPMEVHFVHKSADGALGVIGVMMKIGEHNPVVEGIWQNAPIDAGGEKTIESVKLSAADLMPESMSYYKYSGSLTTPPCSEGVHWHILKDPIEISETQLKAFQALFPVNARPVQPLNERVVTGD